MENFEKEIIYTLRKMSIREIANLPDVSEGLENLIKNSADNCNDMSKLIANINPKDILKLEYKEYYYMLFWE